MKRFWKWGRKKRLPTVLLLSPGIIKTIDRDFGLPHLVSLGSYVEAKELARAHIIDLGYERTDQTGLKKIFDELGPILCIGISCYSSFDYLRSLSLGRFLRASFPQTPIVAGGYHPSACPSDFLFDGSPFDAVVVGEGEKPLAKIVEELRGNSALTDQIYGPDPLRELDELPPYNWQLLDRYWPRAKELGGRFQISLSRGCPHTCTFCMERAKGHSKWRPFSPHRAIDELHRLSSFLTPDQWMINIADPIFGKDPGWRRQVLDTIARNVPKPRMFWTLTRGGELNDEDAELLVRASFAIGVGLESGSSEMVKLMRKSRDPAEYLEGIRNLDRLSRKYGLNYGANLVVGHPGETAETLEQTRSFVEKLFLSEGQTQGFLSVDPFRLYPGSSVHSNMDKYRSEYGAVFYEPTWWMNFTRTGFRAEHIDPCSRLSYEEKTRFIFEQFAPIVLRNKENFVPKTQKMARIFERSIEEQVKCTSKNYYEKSLQFNAQNSNQARPVQISPVELPVIAFPMGLDVKNQHSSQRESSVRSLIDRKILTSPKVIETLLQTEAELFLSEGELSQMYRPATPEKKPSQVLPAELYTIGLQALDIQKGEKILLSPGHDRYLAKLLEILVSDSQGKNRPALKKQEMLPFGSESNFDCLWIDAALPRVPAGLANVLSDSGRAIVFVGPRFRPQDMVIVKSTNNGLEERVLASAFLPEGVGPGGWIRVKK